MDKPPVSISIITYNQVEFIAEAVRSAAEQDYDPLEVVVADDGSTDGTTDLVCRLGEEYPRRVIPLVGGPNLGITGNSNRALSECRGKYVGFLGGDDVLLPGKVERQVEWLDVDERRVLCGHDVEVFDQATGAVLRLLSDGIPMRAGWGADRIVRFGVPFGALAIMVRSAALPTFGFDARLPVVSDWKLWIDSLAHGGRFGFIEGVYARHRRHGGNVTSSGSPQLSEDVTCTLALVEAAYPWLRRSCRFGRAQLMYARGVDALQVGDWQSARLQFFSALKEAFHMKALRGLVLTLLPRSASKSVLRGRFNKGPEMRA